MSKNRFSKWEELEVRKYIDLQKSLTSTKTYFAVSTIFLMIGSGLPEVDVVRWGAWATLICNGIWCYYLVGKDKKKITELESRHWKDEK